MCPVHIPYAKYKSHIQQTSSAEYSIFLVRKYCKLQVLYDCTVLDVMPSFMYTVCAVQP